MSDAPKKHLQSIRTFAKDLDVVRANKNHRVDEPKKIVTPLRPIIKLSEDKASEKSAPKIPSELKTPVPIPVPKITVPLPTPDKKHSAPTSIPAFHELNKHTSSSTKRNSGRINIVSRHASKTSEIFTPKPKKEPAHEIKPTEKFVGGGTIITDTKESSFKLFPSLFKSIESWFKTLSQRRKKRKTPTYTVPETNRRKGVIQKATSKTGTIFTADNETIKEKIRRRRLQEKEHQAETTWSPFTETGYKLLEAPDEPINVKVEFKKQARPEIEPPAQIASSVAIDEVNKTEAVAPAVIIPEAQKTIPETIPVPKETEEDTRWSSQTVENFVAQEAKPVDEVVESVNEVVPKNEPLETTSESTNETEELIPEEEDEIVYDEPTIDTATFTRPARSSNNPFSDFLRRLGEQNTNTQTVVVLLIVLGLVTMFVMVKFIFQHFTAEPPMTITEIPKQKLLAGAKQTDLLLTTEANVTLTEKITEAAKANQEELIEISLLSASGTKVSTPVVFELMQFRTEPSLTQSINTTHFVGVNQSEPAIILGFTDEYSVRGGLLKWEASMGQNLSELFSIEKDIDGTKFKDLSITGFDIRVLEIEGDIQIVYGIVNHNTVIITTSVEKFIQIIKLGFTN